MNADPLQAGAIHYLPGSEFQTQNRQFQGIPGIEVAPNGRIWVTWYSGGIDEGPDNYAILASSMDNGLTWTEPTAVINPSKNIRAYDPTLWNDGCDRMWWFWSQSLSVENKKIHDGRAGVWGAYTKDASVENPVFSEPIRIANGVMMNKPVILSSGEWALPTAVWDREPKLDELKNERFSNITVSADNGKSFQFRGGADVPERSFDEHMIMELKDGSLWMLVRTSYGIGQSFSYDKGRTWTKGEDSKIGGPCSRFFIRRLSSGNILLVNHAAISNGQRSHLAAYISRDEGKTWEGGLILDERKAVSYPDGAEDKNGVIRIVYDRERYKEGEILMASFREEDALAEKCVTNDAKMKMLINKTGGLKNA